MEKAIIDLTKAINELSSNESDFMNYVAIAISLIAIIVSIYSIYVQKKLNDVNLQSTFFIEIFGDYLKKKIPNSAKNLTYDSNGKLDVSYKKVSKEMFSMIRECGYFKYYDNDFYYKLCEMVRELDDYLVSLAGKKIMEKEDQDEKLISIHKEIEKIVHYINKKFQEY